MAPPKGRRRRRRNPAAAAVAAAVRLKQKTAPSGFSAFFLRGLITLAPALLTLVVFGLVFQAVSRYVTGPINSVIYWSLEGNAWGWSGLARLRIEPFDKKYLDPSLLPLDLQDVARNAPEGYSDPQFLNALRYYRHENLSFFRDLEELGINEDKLRDDVRRRVHPLIGMFLSVLIVLWLGWLVGGFMGRKLVSRLDKAMQAIPIVRSVYPYSKQLVEFFFAEKRLEFDTVVAIPYPSPRLYSIGFVTSSAMRTLREEIDDDLVSVFVPSSPMPMTGYTIFCSAERLIPLPITVDEALRITMTGGVLIPPSERLDDDSVLEDLEDHEDPQARRMDEQRPPPEEEDEDGPPPLKEETA